VLFVFLPLASRSRGVVESMVLRSLEGSTDVLQLLTSVGNSVFLRCKQRVFWLGVSMTHVAGSNRGAAGFSWVPQSACGFAGVQRCLCRGEH